MVDAGCLINATSIELLPFHNVKNLKDVCFLEL